MKIFDLLILLLSLLIIGCSSTYKISNFPSKDKFYEDFNKFAKDKSVKVTLVNDSSFYVENGAQIKNDTIYSFGQEIITRNKKIPSSDTVEINYTDSIPNSAEIILKDGEKYQANQIEFNGNSIYFSYEDRISSTNKISSLNKLKCISYRNHWLGIPFGFLGGALLGIGIGGVISSYDAQHMGNVDMKNQAYLITLYYGTALGPILGSIVGWIIGWNYTYEFNP
jgi:hypothetical protein